MGLFLLLSAFLLSGVSLVYPAPVIDAPWGRVSGRDFTVSGGIASYYGYQGIPYALPPIGERRFAKPEPHPGPGAGNVFNASKLGFVCPQPGYEFLAPSSEDCLTLNVYTPSPIADPSQNGGGYTVMVWIHGGGFMSGDATIYIPGQIVTQGDVIVVTIQYRLGVLGFLSSGDDATPGNFGLFDQHLAIKWIKDNIRAFGGNPDTITVFGESAGSCSVGYQVLSPYSQGLISRAVFQSGTPDATFGWNKDPQPYFYMLANATKCASPSDMTPPQWVLWYARWDPGFLQFWKRKMHERVLECLRGVSVDTLLPYTVVPVEGFDSLFYQYVPWVPVVDGDFVPRSPEELIRDPEYLMKYGVAQRDMMLGVNNNEGKILTGLEDFYEVSQDTVAEQTTDYFVNGLAREELKYRFGKRISDSEKVLESVVQVFNFFYTKPRENGKIAIQNVANICADAGFVVPTVLWARSFANSTATLRNQNRMTTSGKLYVYLFNHYPQYAQNDLLQGLNHGEDLYYEFDPLQAVVKRDGFTSEDFALSESFVSLITDFAKSGNPGLTVGRQLTGGVWPQFTTLEQNYLSFGPQPRVDKELYAKRVALWLELVPSLLKYAQAHNPMTPVMQWPQPMSMNTQMRPRGYYYANGKMNFCF